MKVKISKKTAKKICKANRLIAQCCYEIMEDKKDENNK